MFKGRGAEGRGGKSIGHIFIDYKRIFLVDVVGVVFRDGVGFFLVDRLALFFIIDFDVSFKFVHVDSPYFS